VSSLPLPERVCGDMRKNMSRYEEKYVEICGKVCGDMRKSMSRYEEKYVGI